MSWIFFHVGDSVQRRLLKQTLARYESSQMCECLFGEARGREKNQNNDTTWLAHAETAEQSDGTMNTFFFSHHYKHRLYFCWPVFPEKKASYDMTSAS